LTKRPITPRQHEVYRVILSLVLSDITPTRQLIADRLGQAGPSSPKRTCVCLQNAGWIGEDLRPVDGPGRIVRDLDKAARAGGKRREKMIEAVLARARALVAGE
jgi:hypothetical protein